jgi:hypothetical protein
VAPPTAVEGVVVAEVLPAAPSPLLLEVPLGDGLDDGVAMASLIFMAQATAASCANEAGTGGSAPPAAASCCSSATAPSSLAQVSDAATAGIAMGARSSKRALAGSDDSRRRRRIVASIFVARNRRLPGRVLTAASAATVDADAHRRGAVAAVPTADGKSTSYVSRNHAGEASAALLPSLVLVPLMAAPSPPPGPARALRGANHARASGAPAVTTSPTAMVPPPLLSPPAPPAAVSSRSRATDGTCGVSGGR